MAGKLPSREGPEGAAWQWLNVSQRVPRWPRRPMASRPGICFSGGLGSVSSLRLLGELCDLKGVSQWKQFCDSKPPFLVLKDAVPNSPTFVFLRNLASTFPCK